MASAAWPRGPIEADGRGRPYRRFSMAHYEAAADEFHRLSMPYDAALALARQHRSRARRPARSTFSTGSAPTRSRGRRAVIYGPGGSPSCLRVGESATLANPDGADGPSGRRAATPLDDGLTNVELADRLFLSVKTVDHHVSAILAKLEVTKRRDAVRRLLELGILLWRVSAEAKFAVTVCPDGRTARRRLLPRSVSAGPAGRVART